MTPEEFAADCERIGNLTGEDVLPGCADDVEQILHLGIKGNFENEATADGAGWPPRKRKGNGHPLLNESGALKAASTETGAAGNVSRLSGDTLEVGVDAIQGGPGGVPGARVHNFGYPEKNIAQREFMAVNDETVDFTVERAADELVKAILNGLGDDGAGAAVPA